MAGQLEQKKEAGLANQQGQHGGATCRLTTSQLEQLRQLLAQQDFWTLGQITALITQHVGYHYSPSGLRRLLKRMNLFHYKPQPRDYRQSPDAEKQLSTALQATVDALVLRQESMTNFAIGFADEFAPLRRPGPASSQSVQALERFQTEASPPQHHPPEPVNFWFLCLTRPKPSRIYGQWESPHYSEPATVSTGG